MNAPDTKSAQSSGRATRIPAHKVHINWSNLVTVRSQAIEFSRLDSSLKRHTTLIKRIRQSMATDNRDQIMKDLESLSLEKYIDEIAGAVLEGVTRCKTEKDIWSAVEVSVIPPPLEVVKF